MRLICKRCHSWVELHNWGADELADILAGRSLAKCPDCGNIMNEGERR